MRVEYTLNNYQLGTKLRTAPVHKIVRQERIDSGHTVVEFDATENERQFCDKLFARKGRVVK